MGRGQSPRDANPRLAVRLLRASTVVIAVILVVTAVSLAFAILREREATVRTTARFDPPVWAGQNVPGPCSSGGFYAREGASIVVTLAGHCPAAKAGTAMREADGRLVGMFGPPAALADCPAGRGCAPADLLALTVAPDRIPWGHLNLVDMGAGGYRTLAQGTRPLECGDINVGDRVEFNGREVYRSGTVLEIGRYEHSTDTIFPCMVVTSMDGANGDSGAAVLLDGKPAGTVSRSIGGYMAFTPLAEGLANLGLVLCTTPDCDLSSGAAR